MKPTSIIFLVLAVLLIVAGVITCSVANSLADEQGLNLMYTERDEEDNIVQRYSFSDSDITRISLNLGDADVYILGGSDESAVELYNFNPNTLTYTQTGSAITVSDESSFLSLIKITDDGVAFNGLRNLFFSSESVLQGKEKRVEIHLTDEDAVKIYDVTVATGNLLLRDVRSTSDYTAKVGEGNVIVAGVSTSSKLSIEVGTGVVNMSESNFGIGEITVGAGSLICSYPKTDNLAYTFTADDGHVQVNGADVGNAYQLTAEQASATLTAKVTSGAITVTELAAPVQIPEDTNAPESDMPETEAASDGQESGDETQPAA